MKINFSVESHIDVDGLVKKTQDPQFRKYAHEEWHRLVKPYVPRDTGALYENVEIDENGIEYKEPYAGIVYDGHFNFRKDKAPKSSRQWDKAAEATQKPKLVSSLQQYIDSGKLKLQ